MKFEFQNEIKRLIYRNFDPNLILSTWIIDTTFGKNSFRKTEVTKNA